tara:strand:+ start:29 stop:1228 length:1200 start_codon:yes stop_codon:yes gene_type:complete
MQIGFNNIKHIFKVSNNNFVAVDPTQRAWIEVNGNAIANNVRQIRSSLKSQCQFMAVVKADGYGHDALFVSEYAIKGGADQLGVATLQEGIYLRSKGIKVPILILGNVYTKKDLTICFKNNLMPTISSMRECLICNNIGKKYKKNFYLHLKVDTGMSRLGFGINEFIDTFDAINSFHNIHIDGVYSHLATADEDECSNKESFTHIQKLKFEKLLKKIKINKYPHIKVHLANSAGTFLGKEFHFDMVRVGLSMYGYNPFHSLNEDLTLQPALCLKSKVSFIREIEENTGVSYGRKFISNEKIKLAVISIGYADGICRRLSNNMYVIHNGLKYPQIGAITMDQLMIDITQSKNIKVGDSVLLLGSDGEESISPLEWANKASTIPWEILCSFKNRLPRVLLT